MAAHGINKYTYEEATAFAKRLKKFRDSIVPGMSFWVYLETEDTKVDSVRRSAKVLEVHDNWCLLQDNRGYKYGPTYHKLLEWGNT